MEKLAKALKDLEPDEESCPICLDPGINQFV